MSEINWSDYFGRRAPLEAARERKPAFRLSPWLSGLVSWEEWVTFGIVLIVFFSIVQSIASANWVTEMPSLYVTSGLALAVAVLLSRVPVAEIVLHSIGLACGVFAVLWQVQTVVPHTDWRNGTEQIVIRMQAWLDALLTGAISTDTLPFVVLVVSLTWFTAYFSCWSVFRWRNVWVALIPGGVALLTNISYLPGQFSFAFVTFLFGSILLIARLHLSRKIEGWRRDGVVYPEFLSLTVLNWSVLVALALLVAAWALPQADRTGLFGAVWDKLTWPIQQAIIDSNRLFSSIDAKKGVGVHKFTGTLPFQGNVKLSSAVVVQAQTSDSADFLRAVAYDQYTHSGWRVSDRHTEPLEKVGLDKGLKNTEEAKKQYRRPVTVEITTELVNNVLLSVGEPLTASIPAKAEFSGDPTDITAIRPSGRLKRGERYTVVGAVSTAPMDRLRQAGQNYPDWVRERYLQLPEGLPARVKTLAEDWTRGQHTAFDQAQAIESNLRTFSIDYNIPVTPVSRDTVDYFLFDLKRGYFDYHASAMAVLLRSIGIPARVVVGYALDQGEYDPNTHVYLVSERSSYTWVEVYFPGYGWIEFNPSPDRATIVRPGSDTPSVPTQEPSATEDLPMLDEFIDDFLPVDGSTLPQRSGPSRLVLISFWALLLLTVALLLGAVSFGLAWQRAVAGLPLPIQIWEKTVRLAFWAGLGPKLHQTPREYAQELSQKLPETNDLPYLAESYGRTRFGGKPVIPEESQRLLQVWASLRKKLVARVVRWK